jgi:excisionase family DNA binding protein
MDNTPSTAAFTVAQVMERLHIGRDTVYKAIRTGQLPAKKLGKRTLIVASDLEKFLKSLPTLGGEAA